MTKRWIVYLVLFAIFGVTPFIGPIHYILGIDHVAGKLFFKNDLDKLLFIAMTFCYGSLIFFIMRRWLKIIGVGGSPGSSDDEKEKARKIIYRFPFWILGFVVIFSILAPMLFWAFHFNDATFNVVLNGGESMLLSMVKGYIPSIYILTYYIEKNINFVGVSEEEKGFSLKLKLFIGTFGINLVILESMRRFIITRYIGPGGSLPFEELFFFLTLLFISFLVYLFFSKDLTKRISRVNENLKSMAKGSGYVIERIEVNSLDEIGQLSHWFNKLAGRTQIAVVHLENASGKVMNVGEELNKTIINFSGSVKMAVEKVNYIRELIQSQHFIMNMTLEKVETLSKEVQTVLTTFSAQLKAMGQSSRSLETMEGNINEVVLITNNADQITKDLSVVAKQGGDSVQRVISAIQEIEESSKEIADIATVINGISEQTNLLAMNAAIEAAHAGEFGKGFAVVADEIRKLAESSGTNAQNISVLLKDIIERIGKADVLAGEADVGLNKILTDVNKTREINLEIAETTKKQVSGTKELIDDVDNSIEKAESIKLAIQTFEEHNNDLSTTFNDLATLANEIYNAVDQQKADAESVMSLVDGIDEITSENKEVGKNLQKVLKDFMANDTTLENGLANLDK